MCQQFVGKARRDNKLRTGGYGVIPPAGGNEPVPEHVFKIVTTSRIFKLATVTRINERAGA